MNVQQYHWHIQDVVGVDEEAKQHIVALAQRLHEFGHRIEERGMELWNRLSGALDLLGVERIMARNQNEMETEYNNFVRELSDFVNQEITQFGRRLTLIEGTSQNVQNTSSQVREIAQAMSKRVDKVEQQMESVCSSQKEEADQVVEYGIFGLKTEILHEVD